jgi:hypothetical protein
MDNFEAWQEILFKGTKLIESRSLIRDCMTNYVVHKLIINKLYLVCAQLLYNSTNYNLRFSCSLKTVVFL